MRTTIYNPIGDLSKEEIDKFQESYKIKLPKDYIKFMLKYNGGDTDPGHYYYSEKRTDIMTFYNLEWLMEEKYKEDLLKHNLLPIALDVHNYPVCIGLSIDNLDKVYILEIETQNLEAKKSVFDESKLFPLANTFNDFLNSFTEIKIDFPFEKYCEKNNTKKIKKLLDDGLSPNAKSESQESLLVIAVRNNKLEIVKLLIERGANVNYSGNNSNRNPLIYASRSGLYDIVEYLLEKGADINIRDDSGKKAIEYVIIQIKKWEENDILSEEAKNRLLNRDRKCYELLKEAEESLVFQKKNFYK